MPRRYGMQPCVRSLAGSRQSSWRDAFLPVDARFSLSGPARVDVRGDLLAAPASGGGRTVISESTWGGGRSMTLGSTLVGGVFTIPASGADGVPVGCAPAKPKTAINAARVANRRISMMG